MKPAPSVLFHLLPGEALREARELARRFEAEERFRAAVVASFWWLFPVLLACCVLDGIVLFGAALWLAEQAAGAGGVVRAGLLASAALAWLLANGLVLFLAFRHIERAQD